MINEFLIHNLTISDLKSACQLYEIGIADTYEKEGLGDLKEEIQNEIKHKKHMLEDSIQNKASELSFLVAKLDDQVIGAISFGPCGDDIKRCTDNQLQHVGELGSLYVLPGYQEYGIGSALIHAMIKQLAEKGIRHFGLDSGYKRAQKRWQRKFGVPYKIVKDYWAPGWDHMVWLCDVSDYMKE